MKKYGLIGGNVDYSYSKIIHEYLAKLFNIELQYDLISCSDLAQFNFDEYSGLNITIPYKEEILKYANELELNVKQINSCNTLTHGRRAYNTDIYGFKAAINKLVGNIKNIKSVVILGNSKSSEMIKLVFNDIDVKVVSRNPSGEMIGYDQLEKQKADLLINTTPVTMANLEDSPIKVELLKNYQYVYDLNYNPAINRLLADAESLNIPHANGLVMLIMQAVYAFELWHDVKLSSNQINEVQDAISKIIKPQVAIIGMPYSGKTTYGLKMQLQGKKVIDLDQYITEKYDEPSKIIKKKGLEYFRDIESLMLAEVCQLEHDILILGGGIIEKSRNYQQLTNHQIIWKKCSLAQLKQNQIKSNKVQGEIRPLAIDEKSLEKLYYKREIKYKLWAENCII